MKSTLRILDANLNRCAEALRVLEEHARFALESRSLSMQCKEIRHDLRSILPVHMRKKTLRHRDTPLDVGTAVSTRQERKRTPQGIITANCKRAQEALRILEEYGKFLKLPSEKIEHLRYRMYDLEKRLAFFGPLRKRLARAGLYVIVTEAMCRNRSAMKTTRQVLEGGAAILQMREKDMEDRRRLHLGDRLRALCRSHGALFIVNDRVDIAAMLDADGVHLGQEDLPVREARRILKAEKIVGVSTHSLIQARRAQEDGADYIGVGPVHETGTKPGRRATGVKLVKQVAKAIRIPFFPIGGLTLDNMHEVTAAGATRVSICSAIIGDPLPKTMAGSFRNALRADGRGGDCATHARRSRAKRDK